MLDFSVSPLPLVVIAFVNFVLSWLWYSPMLFAAPWQKALGVPEGHKITEEEKRKMPGLFISGIVSSFLLSYALQVIVHSVGAVSFAQGLVAGLALWCGFALTHSLSTLWEGRSPTVLLINNGLFLLTYALFGALVAVWR
jgi:hypothetical protein